MAVNTEQLQEFAQELGLEFEELKGPDVRTLKVDVPTETPRGLLPVSVFVKAYDNGEMFEAVVGGVIPTELHQKSQYKPHFLFYLLHKAWDTKFGTPEVDSDGEVRFLVEIPLADAQMTVKQFAVILRAITAIAGEIFVEGTHVLQHGALPESSGNKASAHVQQAMVTMIEMLGSAEGLAQLKQIAEDPGAPDTIREIANKLLASAAHIPASL